MLYSGNGPWGHHKQTPGTCGEGRAGVGVRNRRKLVMIFLKVGTYFDSDIARMGEIKGNKVPETSVDLE